MRLVDYGVLDAVSHHDHMVEHHVGSDTGHHDSDDTVGRTLDDLHAMFHGALGSMAEAPAFRIPAAPMIALLFESRKPAAMAAFSWSPPIPPPMI